MATIENNLCMVDSIASAFPNVDRAPLDVMRREQMNVPIEELDDDTYFKEECKKLEALLRHAGINGHVEHKNIFDPNPRIVEGHLQDAIASHQAVFLGLLPTLDVIAPHLAHLTGYKDPYLILNGEQVHVELIYEQLYACHRLDIFSYA